MNPKFLPKKLISPADIRRKAWAMIKANMSTALMVCFLVALPGLLSNVFSQIAYNPLVRVAEENINLMRNLIARFGTLSPDQMIAWVDNFISEYSAVLSPMMAYATGFSLLTAFITPALQMGLYNHLNKLHNSEETSTRDVLSRLHCVLKALGMSIIIIVKTLLWTLPGMLLMILAIFVLVSLENIVLANVCLLAGYILSFVLLIRATFHYSLAPYLMAIDPVAYGPVNAVRRSVYLMRHNKMNFFSTVWIFSLFTYVLNLVLNLVSDLSYVVAQTLSFVGSTAITLYMAATVVVFISTLQRSSNFSLAENAIMPDAEGNGEDAASDEETNEDPQ